MAEGFSGILAGTECAGIDVTIDREALVRYAGASDDYVRQHWDHAFMLECGYPDVLAHGWLTLAHMCRVATDWAPHDAEVARFAVRYHTPLYPGLLHCGGRVEAVSDDNIELSLWSRNDAQDLVASAVMTLTRH